MSLSLNGLARYSWLNVGAFELVCDFEEGGYDLPGEPLVVDKAIGSRDRSEGKILKRMIKIKKATAIAAIFRMGSIPFS